MVPFSFGCGSAVLAAIATLAPSRAARSAIESPMPRLPPDTNSVLPLRDVMGGLQLSQQSRSSSPLPSGEVGLRSNPGEGLQTNDRPYPLTPTLSPWERGRTCVVADSAANTLSIRV